MTDSPDNPQPPGDIVGKTLGQYEIQRQLGQGGMASVYLAYQPAIDRTVAIKIMPRHFLHDPNFLQRFQREVKVIAKLQHPRIVPVFDYGQIDGQPYIVMAYMPAGTLTDRMKEGPMPLDEVVRLVEQIAEGLDHAHREGVIHRDFKPSNVLLDKGGNAHLADFGIAKISESTAALTGSAIVGTPAYMAPETANAGEVSQAVDIYALGVTLYQMLTGQHPFQADTPLRVMLAHIRDPLPDIRAVRADLPPGVAAVIQKAMAKDPADRYRTAGEMAKALRAAAAGAPGASEATFLEAQPVGAAPAVQPTGTQAAPVYAPSTPTPTPYPGVAPAAQRGCSRPLLYAGGGLAALLICGGIAAALGLSIFNGGLFGGDTTPTTEPGLTPGGDTTGEAPNTGPWQGLATAADCASGSIVQEIRAVDESTVQFTLCRRDPAFLYRLGVPALSILPREYLEQNAGSETLLNQPVGTGPYRLQSWDENGAVIFTRFDGYWGEPAAASTAEFHWMDDPDAAFLAGEGDVADTPYSYDAIQSDSGLNLLERVPLNTYYLGLPNSTPPFDDVRVRRAIAMGLDRARIAEYYTVGSEVASHFTPCAIPNGCTGPAWYGYDPDGARALLAEAGYPDGFEATFYLTYEPSYLEEELQTQLAELGIDVYFQTVDYDLFSRESRDGTIDGLWINGWLADYPHITNFLDFHFGQGVNYFGVQHPEIYQPLTQAAQLDDPITAAQHYADANTAIRELVPIVPLIHSSSAVVYRADVQGAHASPINLEQFARLRPGDRDTLIWLDWAGPVSFYCADEDDYVSIRLCAQVYESLMGYSPSGTQPEPRLATSCQVDDTGLIWTCSLRQGVTFHDGSTLDAGDVVVSLVAAWDASSLYHRGRTGDFEQIKRLWGLVND